METIDLALDRARRAKAAGKRLFGTLESFAGIGLTRRDGHYAVKVNFTNPPRDRASIPREIDGVPVVVDVVGEIRRQ